MGVTPATVSYVLNQNPHQSISALTREKVLAAAKELGYVPNGAAKVVRGGASYCVGVAMEKAINTGRFNLVLQGIRDEMEAKGYNLMLCGFDRRHGVYADYLNNALERRVDGVVFIGKDNAGPTAECEELLQTHQIPFVAYDCGLTGKPYSTVELDYETAGFEMASHLLAQGAEKIYYLRPNLQNYQEEQREAGVRRALALYNDRRLIVDRGPITLENLYVMEQAMNQREDLYMARQLQRHFVETVMPTLTTFGPRDAVLVSWGMFIGPIWKLLQKTGRKMQLGSLSDVFVSPLMGDEVICCQFLGYDVGRECARLLLLQLEGERAAHRIVMPMPLGPSLSTD